MRDQLALFGGNPEFSEKLFVGTPNVVSRERFFELAGEAFDRRWFSNFGPISERFSEKICQITGAKYCLLVCNATIGLELLFRGLDLEGEVILPSFTFVATAHSLRAVGLTPVFCDVNEGDHTLSPACVRPLITNKTAAILGVHLWGNLCAGSELEALASEKNIPLLLDSAHALGCRSVTNNLADFGLAQVLSFHATKFVNSFEGGAILTHSKDLYDRLRLMSNFGFAGYDDVRAWGTNAKMNEMSAAMGLASTEGIEYLIALNKQNYEDYRHHLADVAGIKLLKVGMNGDSTNYQYVVALVDEEVLGISRDQLMEVLWAENVIARRYFYPGCHRMQPYIRESSNASFRLPVTESLCEKVLILPSGSAVGKAEIEGIAQIVRTASDRAFSKRIVEVLPRKKEIGGSA